jgi:1,2-phenylacetyl-CoA epoxidase catalytic subunit
MTQTAVATYTSREGAPARYLETLEQMMKSQAYRELAAALLFGDGLKHVPSLKWLKFMSWHIREEMEHYEMVVRMYREFTGQSVEPWVNERLAGKPLPMSQSWFELGMAQFLYDRGGFWQLKEYEECSFVPYREVVKQIVSEERGHQELGERIVVELCADPANAAVKQPLFEKWLRIGMLSFGRPGTEGNRYAMGVGLKKRDSGAVMQDFLDDIKPAVRSCGLRFPEPAALGMEFPAELDWSIPRA